MGGAFGWVEPSGFFWGAFFWDVWRLVLLLVVPRHPVPDSFFGLLGCFSGWMSIPIQ